MFDIIFKMLKKECGARPANIVCLGDGAKMTGGPFQDFIGTVSEINKEQGKVQVLVSIFGRETPVWVDFEQVSPL